MTSTPPLRTLRLLPILLAVFGSLACAPTQPTIASGPDAEITHDGLHRVLHTRRFQRVWVKPDANLASYSKILTIDAGVHTTRRARAGRSEFPLTEAQLDALHEGLRATIEESLEQDGHWGRAKERGPDVLVLRVALIDVFLAAPPQRAGRSSSYGSSAGQATLVVELFDSESLEILARIADRRAAERDASSWRNDDVTNRRAAERLFTIWARRLVEALELARSIGPVAVPASSDSPNEPLEPAPAP